MLRIVQIVAEDGADLGRALQPYASLRGAD
jgi:hypothetical protein